MEALPFSRRFHRLKMRLRRLAACVIWSVVFAAALPPLMLALVIGAALERLGIKIDLGDDGQGPSCGEPHSRDMEIMAASRAQFRAARLRLASAITPRVVMPPEPTDAEEAC